MVVAVMPYTLLPVATPVTDTSNFAAATIDDTPLWRARLKLEFTPVAGRTALTSYEQEGPLRVQQLFYPTAKPQSATAAAAAVAAAAATAADVVAEAHCYVLHPPGGMVGGDALYQHMSVAKGAQVVVTTPAAGKFYRSNSTQRQQVKLSVADHSALMYLPQETIFFASCQAQLRQEIEVAPTAIFMGADICCFGRIGHGEDFSSGYVHSALKISRQRQPLLSEILRVGNGFNPQAWTTLHGASCHGVLYVVPMEEQECLLPELISKLQELRLPERCNTTTGRSSLSASTCLYGSTYRRGVLTVRYLGGSVEQARTLLNEALTLIYPVLLGRPWQAPRIWLT